MAHESTFLTATSLLILVLFAVAVLLAARKVAKRRNTYNAWLLPFAYYSVGAWGLWVVQHAIAVTEPLISSHAHTIENMGLWLGVVKNALWATAVFSLHTKHFSRVSQTLPILGMFSIIFLFITYQTTTLNSVPFLIIGAVSCAAIFTTLAVSIAQLPLSKVFAGVFFIHGFSQWIWHYLGFTSFSQSQLTRIATAIWHFALLSGWISLLSEMLPTFRVMISSTVQDLMPERTAVDRALRTLNLDGFRAETFGSLPDTPEAICASRAEQCHIFILIIGKRYGHIFRSKGISVVEFEYDVARAHNPLKILVYIKDDVNREPRLEQFVKRLMDFEGGHKTSTFTTSEDLAKRIPRDVGEWLTSQKEKLTKEHWA